MFCLSCKFYKPIDSFSLNVSKTECLEQGCTGYCIDLDCFVDENDFCLNFK